jgi:hypothetical protein
MSVGWDDIAFELPLELVADVRTAWSWIVPSLWEPVLCSKIGGIFLKDDEGQVIWLDTAVALADSVAGSVEEFHDICRQNSNVVHEWFGTGLVEQLHAAGKVAGPGECYGFTFLPIFAEGKYVPDNMFVAPISEVLIGTAHIQKQIAELPDGSKVQFKVVD